jgi:predicted GTPase
MGRSVNVVIGRKGSGKTAIFLQVRDRIRANRLNVVVDLNPEGYQLLKLKEVMVKFTSFGVRKEFIAAF